jgi:hypothetical protein
MLCGTHPTDLYRDWQYVHSSILVSWLCNVLYRPQRPWEHEVSQTWNNQTGFYIMRINISFSEADNLWRAHFILADMEYHLVTYHRYLAQNLIKIQLIVSNAKHMYMHIMLYYMHFIQIILQFKPCVLSSKELVYFDTSISQLVHGRYA